jgi:hypothetical protein
MKNLIAVVAVIILGIAVGGIIVGFSSTADNIGTQADALFQGIISEDGQWLGAIGSGPEAPGVPQEPDPYEDMGVISIDELGAAVIGTLYENGDLVVSGSGPMTDYTSAIVPFGTSSNPNTSIKRVIIKDGVTTVGNWVFSYCQGLTSVTIPDSVTSIGNQAFSRCSSLTSITIPDSVTSIGYEAFSNCTGLTSITIPDSVTSLGSSAFDSCSSLTSVTIGDSVTSIGDGAFGCCTSLTSVVIPDSVTSIGQNAFYGCSGLTSITIGDSVTSIGGWAFTFCTSLTKVYFEGNAPDDYGMGIFLATPTDLTVYRKPTATGWGPTWGDPSRAVITE